MHYFVFKRHGARWDSLRLLAGPFDDIRKAQQSYSHLPEQQRQHIFVVQEIEPGKLQSGETSLQHDLSSASYQKIHSIER